MITYDKARKDITFCTMLFKMPKQGDLARIKNGKRDFEKFYLESLKLLCETFERVALWCDAETAEYLKRVGWADKIQMRVMDISELPLWNERGDSYDIMNRMKKHVGFFLHRRSPESWMDYLPLMWAKPAVINWAAENNVFKSDYFMWIDAGAFSPRFRDSSMWAKWTGRIDARPQRVRMTIAPTLGKSRPHFVPRFLYDLYKYLFGKPIMPATNETLAKQSLIDIAMTNADYDVPGGSMIMPIGYVPQFYATFERVRKIMKKHDLVCVDQGVFQAMMKFDVDNMFELKYITGYNQLYTAIASDSADHML